MLASSTSVASSSGVSGSCSHPTAAHISFTRLQTTAARARGPGEVGHHRFDGGIKQFGGNDDLGLSGANEGRHWTGANRLVEYLLHRVANRLNRTAA